MCERIGLSFLAAACTMKVLGDWRNVREIIGRRANQVFVYGKHLNILSEGTEAI
jgi:hypothetical protein